MMPSPVFVVSTGRTGTTFLAEILNELGVPACHEPGPRWLRLASNAYVGGLLSPSVAHRLIEHARGSMSWQVEASCLLYGLVEPLLGWRDDVEVVHLIRDPRSYITSAMNWGVHRLGGRPLNLLPYRRLAPVHTSGRKPSRYFSWWASDQFSRLCWSWKAMNQAMIDQGVDHPRFQTIRFEDMFDAKRDFEGLRSVLALTGISPVTHDRLLKLASTKINPSASQRFPSWDDWEPTPRQLLMETCGELAKRFDYSLQGLSSGD